MIPTRIGQQVGGGTFAGFMRIQNQCHALVVSSKQYEVERLFSNESRMLLLTSHCDGFKNTQQLYSEHRPAVAYCVALEANGYNDWYLPSWDEFRLCFLNLKPKKPSLKLLKNTLCNSIPNLANVIDRYKTVVVRFRKKMPDRFVRSRFYLTSTTTETGEIARFDFDPYFINTTWPSTTVGSLVRPMRRFLVEEI